MSNRMTVDLADRVCIVTGGLGHMGRALAQAFVANGAFVVLVDRAEAAPSEVRDAPWFASCQYVAADLSRMASIEQAVGEIVARHPAVSVLVNNAAFVGTDARDGWTTDFPSQSVDHFQKALTVNLTAPFYLTQLLLPALQRSSHGSIINVGSIYGVVGPDWTLYEGTESGNPAGYAASKGGLLQLTRWLATSLAPMVRVNAFCPGGIERGQDPAFQTRYNDKVPMKRMARIDDFVGVCLFLASDTSAYVTGQNIMIDGGWTSW